MPRFITSLLSTFAVIVLVALPAFAQEAKPDPWKAEIDAMLAREASAPPAQNGVVFIGSSSIHKWTSVAQDFPGIPVVNHGFGGSRIADSTRNINRLVLPLHPRVVVIYAGDNDIFEGDSAAQVITDFKAFADGVHTSLPHTPVIFISIKPSVARFAIWPPMREANAGVAALATPGSHIEYVDITAKMLDVAGKPRPELFIADGLHMTPAGYAIWIAALKPVLARHGFVSH